MHQQPNIDDLYEPQQTTASNASAAVEAESFKSVVSRRHTYLKLRKRFLSFVGFVPDNEQFSMQLVGDSGSGKSTYALELANEFSRFGPVLYVCAEENPHAGTIKIRAKHLGISSADIHVLDTSSLVDVRRVLSEATNSGRPYKFCFIDSISVIREGDLATLDLCEDYKHINFVFVNQVNSEGEARGSKKIGHAVDIVQSFWIEKDETRVAYNKKNRYGALVAQIDVFKPKGASSKAHHNPNDRKQNAPLSWSEVEAQRIRRGGRTHAA